MLSHSQKGCGNGKIFRITKEKKFFGRVDRHFFTPTTFQEAQSLVVFVKCWKKNRLFVQSNKVPKLSFALTMLNSSGVLHTPHFGCFLLLKANLAKLHRFTLVVQLLVLLGRNFKKTRKQHAKWQEKCCYCCLKRFCFMYSSLFFVILHGENTLMWFASRLQTCQGSLGFLLLQWERVKTFWMVCWLAISLFLWTFSSSTPPKKNKKRDVHFGSREINLSDTFALPPNAKCLLQRKESFYTLGVDDAHCWRGLFLCSQKWPRPFWLGRQKNLQRNAKRREQPELITPFADCRQGWGWSCAKKYECSVHSP